MEGKNALIKSTLDTVEEMINSMTDEQFIRFREDLGRIRKTIKRRSRSMSVPMSSHTVAAAHRHCLTLGLEMSEWVEKTVRKAITKSNGTQDLRATKKDKTSRKKLKVALPDMVMTKTDESPKVL